MNHCCRDFAGVPRSKLGPRRSKQFLKLTAPCYWSHWRNLILQLCVYITLRRCHLTSAGINTPIESRKNHYKYSNKHDRDILSFLFSSYTNLLQIAATLKKLIAPIIYLFPIMVINVNEIVNLDHRALLRRV